MCSAYTQTQASFKWLPLVHNGELYVKVSSSGELYTEGLRGHFYTPRSNYFKMMLDDRSEVAKVKEKRGGASKGIFNKKQICI